MSEYTATLSSKGQLTLPSAVRKRLGLHTGDQISIVIEGDRVELQRIHHTIDSVRGSIPVLPGVETGDFDNLIDEAMEKHATEFIERMRLGSE